MKNKKVLIGREANIYWGIDNYFANIAKKELDAQFINLPLLVNSQFLSELGYFSNFKENLTKCKPYMEEVRSLSKNNAYDESYLSPAACLPLYPEIVNYQHLIPFCLSVSSPVFRYENGNWSDTRSWEFRVREIILIGGKDYISNGFKTIEEITENFADKNNIQIEIKNSNDSFIPNNLLNRRNKILKKLQENQEMKKEMCWANKNGEEISLGSFNFHNDHFSKRYNWDKNGKVFSGCIGFGIDRWLYAWKRSNKINDIIKM